MSDDMKLSPITEYARARQARGGAVSRLVTIAVYPILLVLALPNIFRKALGGAARRGTQGTTQPKKDVEQKDLYPLW